MHYANKLHAYRPSTQVNRNKNIHAFYLVMLFVHLAPQRPTIEDLQLIVTRRLIVIVWHAARSTSTAIQLARDRIRDVRQLLLLLVEVLGRGRGGALIEPVLSFLDGFKKGLLVLFVEFAAKTFFIIGLVLQGESVVLGKLVR